MTRAAGLIFFPCFCPRVPTVGGAINNTGNADMQKALEKEKKKFRHPLDCTVMTVGILSSYCNGKAPFVALSHPQFFLPYPMTLIPFSHLSIMTVNPELKSEWERA